MTKLGIKAKRKYQGRDPMKTRERERRGVKGDNVNTSNHQLNFALHSDEPYLKKINKKDQFCAITSQFHENHLNKTNKIDKY